MARSNRRRKRAWNQSHRPLARERLGSIQRTVERTDGTYSVRYSVTAQKTYLCPACATEITVGTVHTVAWKQGSIFGEEADLRSRRHWHASCWQRGLRPL